MLKILRTLTIYLLVPLWLCLALAASGIAQDYNDPQYRDAVSDAMVRTADEISKSLWALTTANSYLEWEGVPEDSRVKMTFWTSGWIVNLEGQELRPRGDMGKGDALFLFPSKQLTKWFLDRLETPTVTRIEALLGLPPNTGKSHFAEVWGDLKVLLRPSPDPETSDHEAELDFPGNQHLGVSQTYKDWFTNRLNNTYNDPYPYPFTGLGYTYDWGSDNHVGLSEFIVMVGESYYVIKVYTNEEYFDRMIMR